MKMQANYIHLKLKDNPFEICLLFIFFTNFLHFLWRAMCAAPLHLRRGPCQRRQFDYLRPESNKTRILYYGAGRAESGIMVYGGVSKAYPIIKCI